ncbi:hypothetical protein ACWDUD_28565 [Rhodococcus sp. NPDC003382]
MSIITVVAVLALTAALVWKIGAPVARFVGAALVIVSLVLVVFGAPIAPRLPLLAVGAALWLAGHFLAAYKSRFWHSRLAEAIVTRTPLRFLDPVRGREHRRARRTAPAATRRRSADVVSGPVDHFAAWERELTADTAPAAAVANHVPARPVRTPRGVVYSKRAAKVATNLAVRKVPGARAARSAWRFLR